MPTRSRQLSLVLFPLLLWFATSFFLLGNTGFWSDDYFHNLRGPDNAIPPIRFFSHYPFWSLGMSREFFIRPLFYELVPALTTIFWDAPWVLHLVQAIAHGLAIILFFRLLTSLGISRQTASIASILFMVFPPHFETIFWISALPTTLACVAMLAALLITVNYARRPRPWMPISLALLTITVCFLNEQPVIVLPVLPFLYWAALPTGERLTGKHLLRAFLPPFMSGLCVIAYVLILTQTAPSGARGSSDSFISPADLVPRSAQFFDVLWRRLIMKNFATGAWSLGIDAISTRALYSAIILIALIASAVLWIRRAPAPAAPIHTLRRGPAIAFGLGMFLTGWLPILMFANYEPDSRTRYWPLLGLTLAIASAFSPSLREGAGGRVLLLVSSRLTTALIAIPATILFIGIQSAFQFRWQRDQSEAAQIRQLIPNPKPLSFFLPIDTASSGIRTGAPVFDGHFRSQWEFPWTMPRQIQRIYGRDDVRAGYWRLQTPLDPTITATSRGILFRDRLGPAFPPDDSGGSWIPWGNLIPFTVDEAGVVRIVTHLTAAGETYEVPQSRGQPELKSILRRH